MGARRIALKRMALVFGVGGNDNPDQIAEYLWAPHVAGVTSDHE